MVLDNQEIKLLKIFGRGFHGYIAFLDCLLKPTQVSVKNYE